jgi:hypothetical protein
VDFFLRISSENSFSKLFSVENSYFPQHFMGGEFSAEFFPGLKFPKQWPQVGNEPAPLINPNFGSIGNI